MGENISKSVNVNGVYSHATVTLHVNGKQVRAGWTYKELSRMTELDFATETTEKLLPDAPAIPATYRVVFDADGSKIQRQFDLLEEETNEDRVESLLNTYLLKIIDEYRDVGY